MSLGDDLQKLGDLRDRGVLTDDEFSRAKARLLNGNEAPKAQGPGPWAAAANAFRSSSSDRWLGGVCGGLARVTDIPSWVWRILMLLLVLCGGTGVLLYLLLWLLVPGEEAARPTQPGQ